MGSKVAISMLSMVAHVQYCISAT